MGVQIVQGDCRSVMPAYGPFDLIVADPPYGDTSLEWDIRVTGWLQLASEALKPTGSLWVFGSMRFFLAHGMESFRLAGLRYAQDIVWEKHNGSGFAADRFKRVHEHAVQFYRADAAWAGVYNDVQRVPRTGPDKSQPRRGGSRHTGKIASAAYVDDGTRIQRSVIKAPSPTIHLHPTEKPIGLLSTIICSSCPADGLVGDWFAGSGSCGEAAALTGRSYVGCEIDPEMAATARARLSNSLFADVAA